VVVFVEADGEAAASAGDVEFGPGPAGEVRLAAAEEGDIGGVEAPAEGVQGEVAGAFAGGDAWRDTAEQRGQEYKSSKRFDIAVRLRGHLWGHKARVNFP
jgi:hypothetical protein